MRGLAWKSLLVLAGAVLAVSAVCAAEVVSTTARGLPAVSNTADLGFVPAGTEPAGHGDLAPVQIFEITKPADQSLTIGRMFTSCTCVVLESERRTYGPGERVMLRMRNIQATPPGGQSYALYVQITSPSAVTLRYDTYVQSAQFVPAPEGAPPTRGNIVADGVYSPSVNAGDGGSSIDVIVPKAENYIPDTSEYTLRKKSEEKAAAPVPEVAAKPESVKKAKAPVADKTPAADKTAAAPAERKKRPRPPVQTPAQTAAVQTVAPEPEVPAQIRSAVDAVRDTAAFARAAEQQSASDINVRARSEARVAATLTSGQKPRDDARPAPPSAPARAVLRQPAAPPVPVPAPVVTPVPVRAAPTPVLPAPLPAPARTAPEPSRMEEDDLWRPPTPRGIVRSNQARSEAPAPVYSKYDDRATVGAFRDAAR